ERAWRSARGRRYEPDLHAASYIWRVAARVSRRPLSRREFSRFRNTRHGGAFLKASHRHTRMVGALSACFAVARDPHSLGTSRRGFASYFDSLAHPNSLATCSLRCLALPAFGC